MPAQQVIDPALDAARQQLLLDWYAEEGRDLPWRRTRDPYAVLVSEVMLQQTQVSRVIERYNAWLTRWPTVDALADASTADVLRAWNGLGYNSRALRLHAAVRMIAAAGWPADEAGLRALPGIGPYTAAAIAAFALRLPAAAVDTNQQRVIERWDGAFSRTAGQLRARALTLVPAHAPDAWNHALMDLGATVCTARVAACDRCPMREVCASADRVDADTRRAQRRSDGGATPFKETARYVRGRIVATLVDAAAPLSQPALIELLPDDIQHARIADAVDGLLRDGLIVRDDTQLRLPD